MKDKLYIYLILLIPLLILSCSDEPSSIGLNLIDRDLVNVSEVNSLDSNFTQRSYFYKEQVPLGAGDRLFLGKSANLQSSILIKFLIVLPDSVKEDLNANNITVTSAQIEFIKNYQIGTEDGTFSFTGHKINSGWSSTGFVGDSLASLQYDQENSIVENSIDVNDSTTVFEIDNDLALLWLVDAADDDMQQENGLLVKPTANTDRINGYKALATDGTNFPLIDIVINSQDGYVDTLEFFPLLDLAAVSGPLPDVGTENIAVQGGLVVNSFLSFDLSSIPQKSVVNNAELTLMIDEQESITGSTFAENITAFFIDDSTDLTLDTTNLALLSINENSVTGDITSFVQQWTNNPQSNQGILLKFAERRRSLELFAIKGSNAADSTKRPFLNITYTYRK